MRTGVTRAVSDWPMCDSYMAYSVSVEMGEMQFPEPRASKQKRKEAEAEADRETDKVKV
jgi:hypothetical protein